MTRQGVHTDLTIFRPGALGPNAYNSTFPTAEPEAEYEMREIIASGRYRMLPGKSVKDDCRVYGPHSPVVHDHLLDRECRPALLHNTAAMRKV